MANISINRVTNCNIYVDGESFLGRADEVNLPVLKALQGDHKPLGMVGKNQYPNGFDPMEMDIKWNSFYSEVLKKFSDIFTGIKIQIRTHIEVYEGSTKVGEKPAIIYLTVRPTEIPGGNFKSQENVELMSKLTCSYMMQEIDGEDILEYDAEANIYKVAGVDKLAAYRSSLGI